MGKPTKADKQEQQDCIDRLRTWINPGDTVTTILKSVSRSGTSRRICCAICREGEVFDCTYWVSRAIGWPMNDSGIRVDGCGMDMGFHLVYGLSITLFCPDKYDHDSAYKLKQRWL